MRIDLQVDDTDLLLKLRNGERRLAYAVVNAINVTAKEVQKAEFEHVRREFVVRKAKFFFGSESRPGGVAARITTFASVGRSRPFAEITGGRTSKGGDQAAERRLLLTTFEEGGRRRPFTRGAKSVAVPLTGRPARPGFNRGVDPRFTFAGMRLQAFRGKKRVRLPRRGKKVGVGLIDNRSQLRLPGDDGIQYKGRERTFVLKRSRRAPQGGVFQRFGRGAAGIRLIHKFIPPPQLDSRLDWIQTAERVVAREFAPAMARQVNEVLERQRIREIGRAQS